MEIESEKINKQQQQQQQNQDLNQDQEEQEIDVIYVPIDYNLFLTQYPLRSKDNKEFENFVQPVNCEFKPKQKLLNINYEKTDKFTNLRQDLQSGSNDYQNSINDYFADQMKEQGTMQNKLEQQRKLEKQNQKEEYTITYTSKVINNKTNYFISHYDKASNKIYMFPVDSFLQMRPQIKGEKTQQARLKKNAQQTDIKKISREMERDKNLLQKHPDKYMENKLKNFNSCKEIYNSEQFTQLTYEDISEKDKVKQDQENIYKVSKNKSQNPLEKYPQQIIDIPPVDQESYTFRIENSNMRYKQ